MEEKSMQNTIGVVGSGAMVGSIEHQAAISGFHVNLHDIEPNFLDCSLVRMEKFMDKSIKKGKMDQSQKEAITERITFTTNLEDMKDCYIVIKEIIENLDAKEDFFSKLD